MGSLRKFLASSISKPLVGKSYSRFDSLSTTFLLLVTFSILGLLGDITHDPADILDKYVSLDKKGARLEAMSFEVLKPYITWTEEPAWGQVVVITDYEVSHDVKDWEVINSLEAIIPVSYQVVGAMHWDSATFFSEPRNEVVYFRIRGILNRWRIVDPMIPPHVGRSRLIDFVRERLLEETDTKRVERLTILKRSLEKAE